MSLDIAFTLMVLAGVLLVRNLLVYKARERKLDECWDAIGSSRFDAVFEGEYKAAPSYEAMLFDLRKWTYAQFFPVRASDPTKGKQA